MSSIDSKANNGLNMDEVTPPFPVPETDDAGGRNITPDEITPPFPSSPVENGEPKDVK